MPPNSLPRFALIGLILAAIVALFAYVAGYLTPRRVSGDTIVDLMQGSNGKVFPGFRRAHAKGACVTGRFQANGAGAALSDASLFKPGDYPVIGRFNTGGGDPTATDGRPVFRAAGLRFALPHGEEWRMAIDHTPVFIVSTPADFIALQKASVPDPRTHKPDPAAFGAFVASHPETAAFLKYMGGTPLPSSFANATYHSLNAFRFIDAGGKVTMVRWQFEPEAAFQGLDPKTIDKQPPDFLFDDLFARVKQGPLKWHLMIVPANASDNTADAAIEWTGPHRKIDVGTLVIDRAATESMGNCRDFNYDPMILPKGVAASDDPLLPFRSAAYSASFRRRAHEGPMLDALTAAQAKGAAQ